MQWREFEYYVENVSNCKFCVKYVKIKEIRGDTYLEEGQLPRLREKITTRNLSLNNELEATIQVKILAEAVLIE